MPPSCENPWRISILFPDMSEVQALAIRWDTEVSNRMSQVRIDDCGQTWGETNVLSTQQHCSNSFRIPGLVRTTAGTLLASYDISRDLQGSARHYRHWHLTFHRWRMLLGAHASGHAEGRVGWASKVLQCSMASRMLVFLWMMLAAAYLFSHAGCMGFATLMVNFARA